MKQTYKKPVIIIDLYKFTGMLCASPTKVSVDNDDQNLVIGE
jgi:hypothetical protein